MLDQIQEVVRKNLPAEVGEQLRRYMQAAERWEAEGKRLTREREEMKGKVASLEVTIADLQAKLKVAGDLDIVRSAERINTLKAIRAHLKRQVKEAQEIIDRETSNG